MRVRGCRSGIELEPHLELVFERLKETDPDPRVYDAATRQQLWEQTERLLATARQKAA